MNGMCSRRWNAIALAAGLVASAVVSPAAAADVAFGEYLSGECVTCHRVDGSEKGIPAIVGWSQDQFVAVMNSYRDRVRDNPVMQSVATKLSADEIAALAAYFATLKPPR